ncbi:MAG: acylphosphatase [Ginsengibacter sp.]
MVTLHLIIMGKVQGVFYRASAKRKANELGVTGWIKNTKEGNVEAIISGSEMQSKQFINWCKIGPDKAKVQQVIVTKTNDKVFADFTILK